MSLDTSRTEYILGKDGCSRLAKARVLVFGVGGVGGHLCEALARAGHSSVVIPAVSDTSVYESLIASLDAIIITGGEDINPARYRAAVSPRCGKPNLGRDDYDWAVLTEAVRQRKPLLGICRGAQFMNVFFGGTLYQDIPSELPQSLGTGHCIGNYNKMWITPSAHTNIIVKGTRLANVLGEAPLSVNSMHHQAVKRIALSLQPVATAPDGVIEALEHPALPFFLGVQWHPERLEDAASRQLFAGFINAAETYRRHKG